MCVRSIISIAISLRLYLVATVVVFANHGLLIAGVQAQSWDQREVQTPHSAVTLQKHRSLPKQKPLPNFFLPDDSAAATEVPQVSEIIPVVYDNGTSPSWVAPINPTAPHPHYARSNPSGVPDTGFAQHANPPANEMEPNNDVTHLGNSYFDTTGTAEQTIIEQTTLVLPPVPPLFTQPANRTGNDSGLLSAYRSRPVLQTGEEFQATQSSQLPQGFQPWWSQQNQNPIGVKNTPLQVTLDSLIQRALKNSPHIQVAATQPHIRQAVLLEESSRFDWMSFLESTYDDQNEPVGNTLTLGNNDTRLQQQDWHAEGGIRRQTRTGGEFELSQRFATLQNNSQFLVPEDQGTSRIVLNYRQPLLRGRGRAVNESLIVLANIGLNAAGDEFLTEIQQHLTDLTETYWELVRARSELLQRRGLLIEAQKILNQLEGRSEVDAMERQVFRARSAVAKRKAEIARSVTSVKNAESRIRLLVNDQEIINAARMELVPVDMPNIEYLGISLGDAISTALSNRPDISRSIRDIKATSVQLGIARNDLLPKLDVLVGSYVAGLDDNFDVAGAWRNQFSSGRPGFNIGFEFETAIGNRAAQARQSRRSWEANRAMHQFRAVVETGLTEVELAVREVQTAHQEMTGRYYAMVAAQKESNYLADRWKTLPDESDSVILLLENLLDSQERLVDEESAFAKAQFDYSLAVVKLKQATGTLFQVN